MAEPFRLLRWAPVAVSAFAGLALSGGAVLFARDADRTRVAQALELRVEWRTRDLERKLTVAAQGAGSLAHYRAVEDDVDRTRFRAFAYLARIPADPSSSAYWAPLVEGKDRARFVGEARREVGVDFDIREIAADRRIVVAAERPAYLPLLYEVTFDAAPGTPGFDLLSDPVRRAGAERARDGGGAVATPPLTFGLGENRQPGFLVFWPIYRTGSVPATLEERRATFLGVVGTRFRFERVLNSAIAGTPEIAESIDVAVGGSGKPPQLIARFEPGAQAFRLTETGTPPADGDMRFERAFELLGQRWQLSSRFSAAAVAELESTAPFAWGTFGLLATALLTGFAWRQARRIGDIEADVSEKGARLQAMMDHSLDGLLTFDRTGRITTASQPAEAMFGYPPGGLLGLGVASLMPGCTGPDWIGRRELTALRADGERFPVDIVIGEIPHEDGRADFVGSIRDMTEAHKLAATVRHAQKMEAIGTLTGGMAHDFNNLLGVIIGNLDLAHSMLPEASRARPMIDDAVAAALRGADLTRGLLAFARRQPLDPQTVMLNEQVEGITRLLRRTLGEQIEILLDLAPDVWPTVLDAAQLEAAIANLATNARDAMPNGGRLLIATGNRHLDEDYAAANAEVTAGDYAMIEVSDTGTGMSPEVMARIFEPFFTTKEAGRGTGLGLAMVFGFVKQSAGHIAIYSEPGKGTTFRLYFPRGSAAAAEAAPAPVEAAPARANGERVLVVEDNDALREVATHQLTDLGYAVIAVDGAPAAIEVLQRESVDVLFSDVVMPGPMDGFALAKEALARWPGLKVVLTSGFPETRINGQLGPAARTARLLSKPYRKQDLARLLREVIEA